MGRINTFGVKQAFSDDLQERLIREMDERFIYYQNLNETRIKVFVHHAQDVAIDKNAKKQVKEEFVASSNFGTKFVTANERSLDRDIEDKYSYFKELKASKQFSKR